MESLISDRGLSSSLFKLSLNQLCDDFQKDFIWNELRVNVNKNHRLSKKSRTRSKIDLVHFLPVSSLI